jgi:hypothetical protein
MLIGIDFKWCILRVKELKSNMAAPYDSKNTHHNVS